MNRAVKLATERTVSQRLADYVVDLSYDDIPPPVVAEAKNLLVHHLGLALRARASKDAETAARVAGALGVTDELSGACGACSIIGHRRKAHLLDAVFANTALLASTALHDFLPNSGGHPAIATQPIAWVIGESTRASGRELLTAVVAGYDVFGKLARTVSTSGADRPRRMVFGPLGAAATAARLLGLPREAAGHALGHAAHAGMGIIKEGIEFEWLIDALLARNGVLAAVLADAGMPMSFSTIEGECGLFQTFFGKVPEELADCIATLGRDFEISRARTKRYETGGWNIVPIELMRELTRTHQLSPRRVDNIEVVVPIEYRDVQVRRDQFLERPNTPRTARTRILRLQLAVIVADGKPNPARFDRLPDASLQALVGKIHLRFEANRPLRSTRLEVTTTDGQRHIAEGADYIFPPIDWTEWLADGGRSILSQQQLARTVELIGHLEDVADITEVVDCFAPERPTP